MLKDYIHEKPVLPTEWLTLRALEPGDVPALKAMGIEPHTPKIQIFPHTRAFFVLPYDSMPAPKKHPIARKPQHFGCFAVLKEGIVAPARRKPQKC